MDLAPIASLGMQMHATARNDTVIAHKAQHRHVAFYPLSAQQRILDPMTARITKARGVQLKTPSHVPNKKCVCWHVTM